MTTTRSHFRAARCGDRTGRGRLIGFALLLAAVAAGCASGGTDGERAPRGSATRIIQAEIAALSSVANAWDAVQRLRPQWLRGRGASSVTSSENNLPVIYVNNARLGDIDSLQSIEAAAIREMRFIRAADATTRWGTGHAGGVIEVIVRSGPR
jgi:hypothetical protein